jgi:diguanylate cyclase (GGDEF)-like protein
VAGDRVLREVARRLRAAVRGDDLLARVGGEEFGVLLPGADLAHAAEVGERICSHVRAGPIVVPECSLAVTVSVGAVALDPQDDELSLVSRADLRLYEAKRDGRNCVRA